MTHQLSNHLINQILDLPDAPSLIKKATALLAEEQKRRKQFYQDITDAEKIEFVNGKIVVHSPVMKEHNDVNNLLENLMGNYVRKHKLGYIGIEKVMITLERNDYEPDICFFTTKKSRHFKEGQSLFPAPDLVVEILSKGTAKHDRTIKFKDYQANGIQEYWLIDPKKRIIEQYCLNRSKAYELIIKADGGILKSKAIKGFTVDIEAIFDEDKNLAALMKILSSK